MKFSCLLVIGATALQASSERDVKVDLLLLTDATGSMLKHRREIALDTIPEFKQEALHGHLQADPKVGVMSFRDKPIAGFGDVHDYCVARHILLTDDWDRVKQIYKDPGLNFQGGGRESTEDSLTALIGALQDDQMGWRRDKNSSAAAVPVVVLLTDSAAWLDESETGLGGLPPFDGHYQWQTCADQAPPSARQVKQALDSQCGVLGVYLYDSEEGYHNYPVDRSLSRDELDHPRRFWNQLNDYLEQPAEFVRDFRNGDAREFLRRILEYAAEKAQTCMADIVATTDEPTADTTADFVIPTLPVSWPTVPIDVPTLPIVDPSIEVPTMPVSWPTVPIDVPTLPVVDPSIEAPTMPVSLPTVPIDVPTLPVVDPSIEAPTMPISLPTVPIDVPTMPIVDPSIEAPTMPVSLPTVPIDVPTMPIVDPSIEAPTMPVSLPTVPIDVPTMPIVDPSIEAPTMPVSLPTVPIDVPTMPIVDPSIEAPTMPVSLPTVPIDVPTMPIVDPSIEAPTMPVSLPTIPIDVPTLPVDQTSVPIVAPTMPIWSSIPIEVPTFPIIDPSIEAPTMVFPTDCEDEDEDTDPDTFPTPPIWEGTSEQGQPGVWPGLLPPGAIIISPHRDDNVDPAPATPEAPIAPGASGPGKRSFFGLFN